MRVTGAIRRVDDLGRIVIPKTVRSILGIKEGELIEFIIVNNDIVLRKCNDNAWTPSWIPCSERLPEMHQEVLVTVKTQGGLSMFVSERFKESSWSALCGLKPIAWMTLPEPYNGVK